MTTDDLEDAYWTAETELRAYHSKITAKYRDQVRGPDGLLELGPRPDAVTPVEDFWSAEERTTLGRLRDEAADAALALLQGQGWFKAAGVS